MVCCELVFDNEFMMIIGSGCFFMMIFKKVRLFMCGILMLSVRMLGLSCMILLCVMYGLIVVLMILILGLWVSVLFMILWMIVELLMMRMWMWCRFMGKGWGGCL